MAKRYQTSTATIKRWRVAPAWQVAEVRSLFGLPRRYLVLEQLPAGELVRSTHRKRAAAMKRAQQLAKKGSR